jgi:SAM-dependent methyltransferase
MRDFWDRRAREDAFFFVDDRRAYRDPDPGQFWAEGERDLDRLLGLLDARIEPGEVVVDIGCGVGRLTRVIAARAAGVLALDVSAEMIERARAHHLALGNVEWIVGDGTTLRPIADASADACISHVVFQHIPDPRITLGYVAEIGRVLRPGGWAALQVSNDARVHLPRRDVRSGLRRVAAALRRAPAGRQDPAWLGSAVELGELREVARRAGLELERVVGEGSQFCLIRARRAVA